MSISSILAPFIICTWTSFVWNWEMNIGRYCKICSCSYADARGELEDNKVERRWILLSICVWCISPHAMSSRCWRWLVMVVVLLMHNRRRKWWCMSASGRSVMRLFGFGGHLCRCNNEANCCWGLSEIGWIWLYWIDFMYVMCGWYWTSSNLVIKQK